MLFLICLFVVSSWEVVNAITLVCFDFVLFCIVLYCFVYSCFCIFGRTTWSGTFEGRSDTLTRLIRGRFLEAGLWPLPNILGYYKTFLC